MLSPIELQQKIAQLKKQYGTVFHIIVEDKECFIKKPERSTLSMAMAEGKKSPIKFNEIILNKCWIEGDMEIQTDDEYFLGASSQLAEIVQAKSAEIKKY